MNQKAVSQDQQVNQSAKPDVLVIGAKEDRNTILAALRVYQEHDMGEPANRSDAIHDIATNGGEDISYDVVAIDDLCERVNSAQSELSLIEVSTVDLFAEIRRREAMAGLHSASAALYDQLEQRGHISGKSREISALMFRLKREETLVSGLPDASYLAQLWQARIDQMGQPTA